MDKLFIPVKYKNTLSKKFMEDINKKICKNIGLFTTIQFTEQLIQLKKYLENSGKNVFIGEPNYKALENGQVLGCDISSPISILEKVDCFLYLGTGRFHSILVSMEAEKKVYQANPIAEFIKEIDKEDIEKYKKLIKYNIRKVKNSNKIGILVCTKYGQENLKVAKKIKNKLNKKNKEAHIFIFETLTPEELLNFSDIEAWINTACPRIGIDDIERFDRPIVNWKDIYG